MFTHLDLFAGIGGFARAVSWLGGETVGFVEWDAWCRRVLFKHWPEAHFHGDIKTLTAATLREWGIRTTVGVDPDSDQSDGEARSGDGMGEGTQTAALARTGIDLITGGYPCQPFSLAGQRLGAADDRHLWPEMRRVIDLCRPRYVLAENVAGHVSMGLDTVLAELEEDGYTCGAVVVPACAVNALHRRDRVWIMAYRNGSGTSQRGQRADAAGEGGSRGDQPRGSDGDARQVSDGGAGKDTGGMAHAERGGWREQLRADAAQGALLASIGEEGTSGTGSGSTDAPMAYAPCERDEWGGASRERRAESPDSGEILADTEARGIRRGRAPGHDGQPAQRGQELSDAAGDQWRTSGHGTPVSPDRRSGRECSNRDEAPRPLDAGPHGLPDGLVRRPAAGPVLGPHRIRASAIRPTHTRSDTDWAGGDEYAASREAQAVESDWLDTPEAIRAAWADGSWELNLPRVVSDEPERRQKLQGAGNAIVPLVAYEILRVMLGAEQEVA